MPEERASDPAQSKAWGVDVDGLPDGWTPLDVAAAVKCIDETGTVRLRTVCTEALSDWEALGMHQAAAAALQQDLTDHFISDDDEDEEPSAD